jgi:hypothetical protein
LPTVEKPQMEKIIEQRDGKKTRRKTYPEYLVKWKDNPMEYASWVTEPDILKHGKTVQELMDMLGMCYILCMCVCGCVRFDNCV